MVDFIRKKTEAGGPNYPPTCTVEFCDGPTAIAYEVHGKQVARCVTCHTKEVARHKLNELELAQKCGAPVDKKLIDHYGLLA